MYLRSIKSWKKNLLKAWTRNVITYVENDDAPNLDYINGGEGRFPVEIVEYKILYENDLDDDLVFTVEGGPFELGHEVETIIITSNTLKKFTNSGKNIATVKANKWKFILGCKRLNG